MLKMGLVNPRAVFDDLERQMLALIEVNDEARVAAMVKELEAATPVDTGLAKASWQVQKQPWGWKVENTVEYIQYLNEGSSQQAPAHFVEMIALKYGKPHGTIVETLS